MFFWNCLVRFDRPWFLECFLSPFRQLSRWWCINSFCNIQENRDCFSLAVERVCFPTILGSNQLTGATNWQNGLFRGWKWARTVIIRPFCSPGKPGGENFVTYFFLLWSYWKRFLRFPTKTSAVGSQQSANRPLYGEIGSGPVIKSRFVRFWWHQCVPVTLADNWISVNIQCRYKFLQRWSSVDNWTVLKHARQGQSECQLCGVPGGYKQYGGPILGRTMRVCGTKLEKVENNERQFSCCEPATWRPKAPPFPTLAEPPHMGGLLPSW